MVGADEPVSADGAGKLLVAGVRATVAGELVGTGKTLVATGNGAAVRAFSLNGKKKMVKIHLF